MRADRLVYDLNTGAIRAIGNVQIVLEDGSVTYAEEIEADEAMNVGAARELRARLGETARSRRARRCATAKAKANFATSSTQAARSARPAIGRRPGACARGARCRIARAARSPIKAQCSKSPACRCCTCRTSRTRIRRIERASGFLPPNIGRNRRLGTFYEQPYYWAISPSQDLTASLRIHGNVNPLVGLEYRKRFWSGELEIDTTFTQEQLFDTDGDSLRRRAVPLQRLRPKAVSTSTNYWDWGFGVERIYDDEYLRRYDHRRRRRAPRPVYRPRHAPHLAALRHRPRARTPIRSIAAVGFQGLRETDTSDLLPVILPFAETEHVLNESVLGGQLRCTANTAVLLRDDNPATLALRGQ